MKPTQFKLLMRLLFLILCRLDNDHDPAGAFMSEARAIMREVNNND